MTTDELIARAEASLKGITPGLWYAEGQCVYHSGGHRLVASLKAHEWGRDWPTTERDLEFIAASRQLVPDLIAALRAAEARAERAGAALERDRTKVAETINAVHSEIAGREWMLTGRGPYEWDDDRYRDEFAQALAAIRGPIDSLRIIARDWTNCPTDPEKIKAARTRAERAEAMIAAAYRDAAKLCSETSEDILEQSGACSRDISAWLSAQATTILARTPADAQATLDRIRQQAADDALERAAKVADACEDSHWGPAIASAIRRKKGGA